MKFSILAVLAVLAVLVAAPAQVQAQYPSAFELADQNVRNTFQAPINGLARNLCANHQGDEVGLSWCHGIVVDQFGRPEGINPNAVRFRGGYRYGYGRRYSGWDPYILGFNSGFGYGGYDTPADCVKKTIKAFKKAGEPVDPEAVMAFCSGQPMQPPPPPVAVRAEQRRSDVPVMATGPAPDSRRRLVNNTKCTLRVNTPTDTVTLAPGQSVVVTDPAHSDIQAVQNACTPVYQVNGTTITVVACR